MGSFGRRQLLHGATAAAMLAALPRPALAQIQDGARAAMARAAAAFVQSLEPAQRQAATFPLGHEERRNWHYIPRSRAGIAFKDMSPAARAAAHELMKASLSGVGYAKAVNVVKLEEVLRQLETFGGLLRDPEKYYVSLFGAPDPNAAWGWRLEGHHLSLNFTLVPGRPVSVTPAFFGANPAEVPSGPHRGLRALAEEQDLAFALARGVDASLRGRLVIAAESPGDIVSGPGRADSLKTPAGVALGELGAEPRALALRLIETYARNMRSEIADEELRRMREAGSEEVRFAWAGPIDPKQPHYYRLHGPTLLIEYDNSQNRANHVHSVWHDPRNDFGADLLRAHYERSHGELIA
ncbi:MAG TPA: DUF3500 domain-containing protein [Methylomirabilota bacterium]|jgi:hypothetical protein|nr:DUF3500 domain-containing protein [Methylomirabilota bacterium]